MNWEEGPGGSRTATGREHEYLAVLSTGVNGDVHAVLLTRYRRLRGRDVKSWLAVSAAVRRTAGEAARNTIRLPFGRGPGRPGLRTAAEVAAMFALAQDYAERYEETGHLDGYPEWTHDPGPHRSVAGNFDVVEALGTFTPEGGSDDCPDC